LRLYKFDCEEGCNEKYQSGEMQKPIRGSAKENVEDRAIPER
jgi:hypothetical protein